jgi:hypothetical protein
VHAPAAMRVLFRCNLKTPVTFVERLLKGQRLGNTNKKQNKTNHKRNPGKRRKKKKMQAIRRGALWGGYLFAFFIVVCTGSEDIVNTQNGPVQGLVGDSYRAFLVRKKKKKKRISSSFIIFLFFNLIGSTGNPLCRATY